MKAIALVFMGTLAVVDADAKSMTLFTPACEEALALSALPQRLRDDATAYVLEKDGYRKSKSGGGAFSCLVTRNHPDSIIPLCFDREGTEKILPSSKRRGEMILSGSPNSAFLEERQKKFEAGDLLIPGPGVSYMVSDYNYIYAAPLGRLIKVAAHMMYYAPFKSDSDIGGSRAAGAENQGMPFINDEGIHGMMISYVEEASDSSDVITQCEGQLPEPPQ